MKRVVKLSESKLTELVKRIMSEQDSERYMFFSNLEQIHRQMGILLEKDPEMINDILENGHDWAQDHIATAKESIDQVFDFIMNEENGDSDEDFENDEF
jgi:prephenate dehydrogenase